MTSPNNFWDDKKYNDFLSIRKQTDDNTMVQAIRKLNPEKQADIDNWVKQVGASAFVDNYVKLKRQPQQIQPTTQEQPAQEQRPSTYMGEAIAKNPLTKLYGAYNEKIRKPFNKALWDTIIGYGVKKPSEVVSMLGNRQNAELGKIGQQGHLPTEQMYIDELGDVEGKKAIARIKSNKYLKNLLSPEATKLAGKHEFATIKPTGNIKIDAGLDELYKMIVVENYTDLNQLLLNAGISLGGPAVIGALGKTILGTPLKQVIPKIKASMIAKTKGMANGNALRKVLANTPERVMADNIHNAMNDDGVIQSWVEQTKNDPNFSGIFDDNAQAEFMASYPDIIKADKQQASILKTLGFSQTGIDNLSSASAKELIDKDVTINTLRDMGYGDNEIATFRSLGEIQNVIDNDIPPKKFVAPEKPIQEQPIEQPQDIASEQIPQEQVATPEQPLPEWLSDELDRNYALADQAGIVGDIEELSAQRLTAKQIAKSLKDKMPTDKANIFANADIINVIRSVRSKLNIPNMDDATKFESWLKNRKPLSEQAIEQPPVETPPEVKATTQGKEAWEMTKEDFIDQSLETDSAYQNALKASDKSNLAIEKQRAINSATRKHGGIVTTALLERKDIPESVLADYPDLKPKATEIPATENIADSEAELLNALTNAMQEHKRLNPKSTSMDIMNFDFWGSGQKFKYPHSKEELNTLIQKYPDSIKIDKATGLTSDVVIVNEKILEKPNAMVEEGRKPIQEINANKIAVKPEFMQYKQVSDKITGENEAEKLKGQWDDHKGGILLLWQPNDPAKYGLKAGQKYIVANGHHRLRFGKEQNIKSFNSQVLKESDGYSVGDARSVAAEINITEGRGTVYDQVKFLREQAGTFGKDEAMARAGSLGVKGRQSATIAFETDDSLYSAFINEIISPEQTEIIAKASPNNDIEQQIGIKFALRGVQGDTLKYMIKAMQEEKAIARSAGSQIDLFGQDDTAMIRMEKKVKIAEDIKKGIRQQVLAVQGAAKRPDLARTLGVDVGDPMGVNNRIASLKSDLAKWENWSQHPELVKQVNAKMDRLDEIEAGTPKEQGLDLGVKAEETPKKDEENLIFMGSGFSDVTTNKGPGLAKHLIREINQVVNPASLAPQEAVDIMRQGMGKIEQSIFNTERLHLPKDYFKLSWWDKKILRADRTANAIKKQWDKIPEQDKLDFASRMEEGTDTSTMGQMVRDRLDAVHAIYKKYKDLNYINNFYPHFFKKPNDPATIAFLQNMQSKRPIGGSGRVFKHRIFADLEAARANGFELVTTNPEELLQMSERDAWKFQLAQDWKHEFTKTGYWKFVRGGTKAPDGFVKIDDKITKVWFPPEIAKRVINGKEYPGRILAGEYYVQEDLARLIKNYLSHDFIYESKWGTGLMNAKLFLNTMQLGVSAFHFTAMTLDAMWQRLSLGYTDLLPKRLGGGGKPLRGLKNIATTGIAPIEYLRVGRKFFRGDPAMVAEIGDAMFTGGASLKSRQYYRSTIYDDFRTKLREIKAQRQAGKNVPYSSGNTRPVRTALSVLLRTPLAITEMTMRPLFEYYIPRMKVGAFQSLYAQELERNAVKLASGELSRTQLMASTWANIENRMGELNYDALMWNKTFKSGMMLAFRAVGWNVGTIRELGGGFVKDTPKYVKDVFTGKTPNFTPKMAYILALFTGVAALNTAYQILHGEGPPKELKDLFYPKNGEIDANGNHYRVQPPTYLKDVYAVSHHPISMIGHKFAPEFAMGLDLIRNKDFFGDYIRDTHDNIPAQTKQLLAYTVNNFEPFSFQQVSQQLKGKAKPEQMAEAFMGITKAPRDVITSEEQKKIEELYREQRGERGPRTPEQKKIDELKSKARKEIRKGDYTSFNKLKDMGTFANDASADRFSNNALKEQSTIQKMYDGLTEASKDEVDKLRTQTQGQSSGTSSGYHRETPTERTDRYRRMRERRSSRTSRTSKTQRGG